MRISQVGVSLLMLALPGPLRAAEPRPIAVDDLFSLREVDGASQRVDRSIIEKMAELQQVELDHLRVDADAIAFGEEDIEADRLANREDGLAEALSRLIFPGLSPEKGGEAFAWMKDSLGEVEKSEKSLSFLRRERDSPGRGAEFYRTQESNRQALLSHTR